MHELLSQLPQYPGLQTDPEKRRAQYAELYHQGMDLIADRIARNTISARHNDFDSAVQLQNNPLLSVDRALTGLDALVSSRVRLRESESLFKENITAKVGTLEHQSVGISNDFRLLRVIYAQDLDILIAEGDHEQLGSALSGCGIDTDLNRLMEEYYQGNKRELTTGIPEFRAHLVLPVSGGETATQDIQRGPSLFLTTNSLITKVNIFNSSSLPELK